MVILLLFVLVLGFGLLLLSLILRKSSGAPSGSVIYTDTDERPGEILQSTSVPLSGKPDYLVKKGEYIIPVEIKTGKTPRAPYANHVAQLYAYCLLVEENFGVRPPYGIVKYPDQEIQLEFKKGTEDHLRTIVEEMLQKKKGNLKREEINHSCRSCREHSV